MIQYLPQTTFISFVCNFGGLLGMWLRLSVVTILSETLNLLLKSANIFKNNYISVKNKTILLKNYYINNILKNKLKYPKIILVRNRIVNLQDNS